MKFYFNNEACKIEHQTEWMKLYEEEFFSLLANGKHIYFSCKMKDNKGLIFVLDPNTMMKNKAFPDKGLHYLNGIFKLTEDYVLIPSMKK